MGKKISPYFLLFLSSKFGYLAYNGLNNTFMSLNKNLYELMRRAEKDINALYELDEQTYKFLEDKHIIVSDDIVDFYIQQKKFIRTYSQFQHNELYLTIAPTTACNFSCPYCFEKGINPKTMTQKVIEDTIEFIRVKSLMTNKKVKIDWYGGEPLLAAETILFISEQLKKYEIETNHNSIITNGYYLNKENIQKLIQIKIKVVQITLDGATPEIHNKRRFMADGVGSWDKITENIDLLLSIAKDIQVHIRCNIDKTNKDDFLALKENFDERWKRNRNVTIYPAILRDHETDEYHQCDFLSRQEAFEFFLNEDINNGNLSYMQINPPSCSSIQLNSYLIGPEGELYKCWNDLGRKDKTFGNVSGFKITNQKLLFDYIVSPSMFDDKNCLNCKLFFVCDGGCQWQRLTDYEKSAPNTSCHMAKNGLEKYLETYYSQKNKKQHEEKS